MSVRGKIRGALVDALRAAGVDAAATGDAAVGADDLPVVAVATPVEEPVDDEPPHGIGSALSVTVTSMAASREDSDQLLDRCRDVMLAPQLTLPHAEPESVEWAGYEALELSEAGADEIKAGTDTYTVRIWRF